MVAKAILTLAACQAESTMALLLAEPKAACRAVPLQATPPPDALAAAQAAPDRP